MLPAVRRARHSLRLPTATLDDNASGMATAFVAHVALATVVTVLTRPWGVRDGPWALVGGLLLVATGRLPPLAALHALRGVAGVFIFLVGLNWLTLVVRHAGLFERAARLTVRAANGDCRRLLAAVFVLGTLTTALLSNDATVVLLTPVVLSICSALELSPLPYVFAFTSLADTDLADTASSMLPISNP